jgi:hypothetical protein
VIVTINKYLLITVGKVAFFLSMAVPSCDASGMQQIPQFVDQDSIGQLKPYGQVTTQAATPG